MPPRRWRLVRNVHSVLGDLCASHGVKPERARQETKWERNQMIDVVLMIVAIGFFLMCWGYALACSRI